MESKTTKESDWGLSVMSQPLTIAYKRPWWKFWEKSYSEQLSNGEAQRIYSQHMKNLKETIKWKSR